MVVNIPASHIVVNDTYFYSLVCFIDKCIGNELSQGIVIKNIGIDMDVVGGFPDGLEQSQEVI